MHGHVSGPGFKPNPKIKGGSRKGKPQGNWPWVIKVGADAVRNRPRGGLDAQRLIRRAGISLKEFKRQMETLFPGIWEEAELNHWVGEGHTTPAWKLLWNRPYKGSDYSGTSDRGPNHDPKTRAMPSREDWRYRFGVDHPLAILHEKVSRSQITTIPNWKEYL